MASPRPRLPPLTSTTLGSAMTASALVTRFLESQIHGRRLLGDDEPHRRLVFRQPLDAVPPQPIPQGVIRLLLAHRDGGAGHLAQERMWNPVDRRVEHPGHLEQDAL